MFGECLKRAEVAARTFAMPDAVRTWLPPAEPAESQSPAEPVDAPAPPSLGAVLAEAAEPTESQSPAEFSTPPTQPEAIEASAAEAVGPADEGELAAEQRPCKKSRLP